MPGDRPKDESRGKWCAICGRTKTDVGAKASPVIGQNALDSLVYYTVTGLSEDGRAQLHDRLCFQAG